MRHSRARCSGSEASRHSHSSADCITTTCESEFSVHTRLETIIRGPAKFVTLSPARLPSKKRFSEFCGNARVAAARSAPEIVRDLIPPAQNSRPNLASGLFVFNFEILRANARCGTRSQSAQRFRSEE